MQARCRLSGRGLRSSRSRWSTRPKWVAAHAHRPAADASFWARQQRRRLWAKHLVCRCRTRRWRLRGRPSGWMLRSDLHAQCIRLHNLRLGVAQCLDGCRGAQCDGAACGVWRLDESAAASAGDCIFRGIEAAHACGLGARSIAPCRALLMRCPMDREEFATVQVFLAGGVPEVMLDLRSAGLLDTSVKTVSGDTLDASLDWWQRQRAARSMLRKRLKELDGIDADDVIMTPDRARSRGIDGNGMFSCRQSCAGGFGHQEHGDRSIADRRR